MATTRRLRKLGSAIAYPFSGSGQPKEEDYRSSSRAATQQSLNKTRKSIGKPAKAGRGRAKPPAGSVPSSSFFESAGLYNEVSNDGQSKTLRRPRPGSGFSVGNSTYASPPVSFPPYSDDNAYDAREGLLGGLPRRKPSPTSTKSLAKPGTPSASKAARSPATRTVSIAGQPVVANASRGQSRPSVLGNAPQQSFDPATSYLSGIGQDRQQGRRGNARINAVSQMLEGNPFTPGPPDPRMTEQRNRTSAAQEGLAGIQQRLQSLRQTHDASDPFNQGNAAGPRMAGVNESLVASLNDPMNRTDAYGITRQQRQGGGYQYNAGTQMNMLPEYQGIQTAGPQVGRPTQGYIGGQPTMQGFQEARDFNPAQDLNMGGNQPLSEMMMNRRQGLQDQRQERLARRPEVNAQRQQARAAQAQQQNSIFNSPMFQNLAQRNPEAAMRLMGQHNQAVQQAAAGEQRNLLMLQGQRGEQARFDAMQKANADAAERTFRQENVSGIAAQLEAGGVDPEEIWSRANQIYDQQQSGGGLPGNVADGGIDQGPQIPRGLREPQIDEATGQPTREYIGSLVGALIDGGINDPEELIAALEGQGIPRGLAMDYLQSNTGLLSQFTDFVGSGINSLTNPDQALSMRDRKRKPLSLLSRGLGQQEPKYFADKLFSGLFAKGLTKAFQQPNRQGR